MCVFVCDMCLCVCMCVICVCVCKVIIHFWAFVFFFINFFIIIYQSISAVKLSPYLQFVKNIFLFFDIINFVVFVDKKMSQLSPDIVTVTIPGCYSNYYHVQWLNHLIIYIIVLFCQKEIITIITMCVTWCKVWQYECGLWFMDWISGLKAYNSNFSSLLYFYLCIIFIWISIVEWKRNNYKAMNSTMMRVHC